MATLECVKARVKQNVPPNFGGARWTWQTERRFRHVPIGPRFVNEITPAAPNAPAEARRRPPNIKPPIMTPRTATLPPHERRRTGREIDLIP